MSEKKTEPVELLTAADRKNIVNKLLQIMAGPDPRLAMRSILKLIEIEKQNQKDQHFYSTEKER